MSYPGSRHLPPPPSSQLSFTVTKQQLSNYHSYPLTSNSPHKIQSDSLKNIFRKCHFPLQYLSMVFHHTQKKIIWPLTTSTFTFKYSPVSLLKCTDPLLGLKHPKHTEILFSKYPWNSLSSFRCLLKSHFTRECFPNHLFTSLLLSCVSFKANRWLYVISPNDNVWSPDLLITDHLVLDFSVIRANPFLLMTSWHEFFFFFFHLQRNN